MKTKAQAPEWEYGFYDEDVPPDRYSHAIFWYCFGMPFKTAEMAEHTGSKSTWSAPVIVRRHPGSTEWEVVS